MKFLPTLALARWTRRSRRAGRTVTLSSLLHFHISLVKLNSSRPPSITLLIILILNLHRTGYSPSSSCYIGDKNCCTDRPRRSHSQIFERIKTVRFLISKYKFYCRQRMLHDNCDDEFGENSCIYFTLTRTCLCTSSHLLGVGSPMDYPLRKSGSEWRGE